MATIKDVAKLANVSVATVSRVINGTSTVQGETKKRVNAAIKELNYSPNLLGRNLRRLETKKILVLLNTISNQFYSLVVKGIEEKALEQGYTVMVCMTHGNKEIENGYMQMLKTKLVDGAIMLTTEEDGEKLTNELRDVFVVQACEPREKFITPTVCIDNEKAAYDAVSFLIKKGHKKIGFFGAGDIYQSSLQREKGYKKALLENNLVLNEEWILHEGFSFNAGKRGAQKIIKQNNLPTAIFCVSDSCAAGAIKTFIEHNIFVPKDISVMGFDNTHISQMVTPTITTVKQPQYEIGYKAMELLFEKMTKKTIQNKNVILDYSIVERESVI